jgi:hypothetical protein
VRLDWETANAAGVAPRRLRITEPDIEEIVRRIYSTGERSGRTG